MRLPITLSLLLTAAASLHGEAPSIQGTLPEDSLPGLKPLLTEAVERSPSSISASLNIAVYEAGRYGAVASLLPHLSGGASYSVNTEAATATKSTTQSGIYYNANVSQNLFEWGALKNQVMISNLSIKIASRQYEEAYRQLAVVIREQYMALIARKITLRNEQFKQRIADENMNAEKAKFEAGSVSQAELQGYSMLLEDAALSADRAQEDYDYSKRVLTRLVGIDDLSDDSIPLEVPHPTYSAPLADLILTGFVGDGVESTFQNEIYRMQLKQSDLNYSIAKVRLLPTLGAGAGFSKSNNAEPIGDKVVQIATTSENYAITANWNIFDGFATRGAKLSALVTKRLYERQRKTYIDQAIDSVTDMRHRLGFAARGMSLAEVRNALVGAEVKRLGEDKDLGYASQATIDTGTLNFYATQSLMATARAEYFGLWTEFVSVAGIDPALANISPRYVR